MGLGNNSLTWHLEEGSVNLCFGQILNVMESSDFVQKLLLKSAYLETKIAQKTN